MEQIEDGRWTTESALARLVERQGSLIKKLTEQRNALLAASRKALAAHNYNGRPGSDDEIAAAVALRDAIRLTEAR